MKKDPRKCSETMKRNILARISSGMRQIGVHEFRRVHSRDTASRCLAIALSIAFVLTIESYLFLIILKTCLFQSWNQIQLELRSEAHICGLLLT